MRWDGRSTWGRSTIRAAHARLPRGQVDPTTGLVATKTGYIRDPIANNDITTLGPLDPTGAKLVGYYPTPTGSGLTNNFCASGTAPAHSNEYLVRVDHNIKDSSRLYFRYSYKQEFKTGTPDFWGSYNPAGPGNGRPNNRCNMAAGFSQVFSPKFTMNILAGVELWHETSTNQSRGFKPSSIGLPTYLDENSPQFPIVNIGGESPLGPLTNETVTNHGPIGSVSTDFIRSLGRHTLNFGFMGVELEDDQASTFNPRSTLGAISPPGQTPTIPTGFSTGNGMAQLMLGVIDNTPAGKNPTSAGTPYNPAVATHYFGWYVQDDWNPLPKLTLNLGMRYEIQTAPTYRHNVASVFNPNTLNPIGTAIGETATRCAAVSLLQQPRLLQHKFRNVAPRIGFAYQVGPKFVVRGGYGIFYPPSISCCFETESAGFAAPPSLPLP